MTATFRLPPNPTATDVIDALSDQAYQLVLQVNDNQPPAVLTHEAFARAHARCFTAMLDTFLTKLDADNPRLAQHIRTEFLDEQAAREAAGKG